MGNGSTINSFNPFKSKIEDIEAWRWKMFYVFCNLLICMFRSHAGTKHAKFWPQVRCFWTAPGPVLRVLQASGGLVWDLSDERNSSRLVKIPAGE